MTNLFELRAAGSGSNWKVCMRLIVIGLSLALVGCSSASTFVRTDEAHKESPSTGAPDVCARQRPTRPYRVVGEIRVRLDPEVSTDLDFMAEAMRKAAEVGCDGIIDARLGHTSAMSVSSLIRLVHGDDGNSSSNSANGQGGRTSMLSLREYECIVYVNPNSPRSRTREEGT